MICLPETFTFMQVLSLLGIAAGGVMVALYLWSRKSAKHPEYAAALEAKLDAALRAKGLNTIADYNLVGAGQEFYAGLKAAKAKLEAEAQALIEQAKAKQAEAEALAKKIVE